MAEHTDDPKAADAQVDAQAREQTGSQQVRLRLDDRDMTTMYANAFRTNTSAEEVIIDFGMNLVVPSQQQQQGGSDHQPAGDILFKLSNRVVMNYYTAKRLALLLGQVVRRYEDRFGELKLNAADRAEK